MQQLITIDDVAQLLALSKVTVTHWSYGHRPAPESFPVPIRIGRQLRYVAEDVDTWIMAKRGLQAKSDITSSHSPKRRGAPRKTKISRSIAGV